MLLSGNGAKSSTLVQGAVTNSKTKGFTDHNKKWLKPKAPVASPAEPVEKLMDDSDTDDGAAIHRVSSNCVKCCCLCRSDDPSVVHCCQTCAGVMDDEFDGQGGDALLAGSSEEEPVVSTVSEAKGISGGLNDGEHVSMRGELWSDEDESFEGDEAGTTPILPSERRMLRLRTQLKQGNDVISASWLPSNLALDSSWAVCR